MRRCAHSAASAAACGVRMPYGCGLLAGLARTSQPKVPDPRMVWTISQSQSILRLSAPPPTRGAQQIALGMAMTGGMTEMVRAVPPRCRPSRKRASHCVQPTRWLIAGAEAGGQAWADSWGSQQKVRSDAQPQPQPTLRSATLRTLKKSTIATNFGMLPFVSAPRCNVRLNHTRAKPRADNCCDTTAHTAAADSSVSAIVTR